MVLGAGSAGLAAELYVGRKKMSVFIIEKGIDGSQALTTRMSEQVKCLGCEYVSDVIIGSELEGDEKSLSAPKASIWAKPP